MSSVDAVNESCRLGILLIKSSDFARLIMVIMSGLSRDFFCFSEGALNVRLEDS